MSACSYEPAPLPFDPGHTSWCPGDCAVTSTGGSDEAVLEIVHDVRTFEMPLRPAPGPLGRPRQVQVHLVKMAEFALDGAEHYTLTDVVLDGREGTYSLTVLEAARLGAALLRAARRADRST